MDYYPSIDYETLNSEYGTNHNIIFDRQKLNEDKFYDLIDNNYFTNFDEVVYEPYGLFVKTNIYLLSIYGGYIQIERVIDGEVTYIEILEEDYVNETKADVLDYLDTIF